MAATWTWKEDYGTQTGSPLRGTSTWNPATNINWSSNVDPTTTYSSNSISNGNNSSQRYSFGALSGTFNQVSNGLFAANTNSSGTGAGAMATGLTLLGTVTSTYATPVTSAMTGTDFTAGTTSVGSGSAVSFSTTGPYDASPTTTLSATGTTQYTKTQLKTTSSATGGDITTTYIAIQYSEN